MPSTVRRRQRKLAPRISAVGAYKITYANGSHDSWTEGSLPIEGSQITDSESHPWPPVEGDTRDLGGNFYTRRQYVVSPKVLPFVKLTVPLSHPNKEIEYSGNVLPVGAGLFDLSLPFSFPPSHELSDDALDEKGATAVARCKPGEPYIDLSTSLSELFREGIPSVLGKDAWKDKTLAGFAGEYLKLQFGYKPIASDVKKMAAIASKSQELLAQFERDAGRRVRRRYKFPLDTSESTTTLIDHTIPNRLGTLCAFGGSPMESGYMGKTTRTRRIEQRVWFSGSFTYYLPKDWKSASDLRSTNAKWQSLLGLEFTPETLWNIAPWSWALDWFANTGDVVSNLNDFLSKRLVMHYGYIMCETFVTDSYNWSYNSGSYPGRPTIPDFVVCTNTKQRREANPFGFGVSWDGLNPFQVSIAAALGLSRKR